MTNLQFAVLGAGFRARYQLAAWGEIDGAECVAICDPDRTLAESLATEFNIPAVYDSASALLDAESVHFVVILSPVETHPELVQLAAERGVAAICQTPMAPTLEQARQMVQTCDVAKVPFFIHENWRWQTPLRQLKKIVDSSRIGQPFRARLDFITSYPVFVNQPDLRTQEQFIVTDIGSHVLDAARFLFGDAQSLYCRTQRIRKDIKGEDVATILLEINGVTVTCNLSYASRTAAERFPQTFAFIEGSEGSVELNTDYWIHITNSYGTLSKRHAPPRYAWAEPSNDVVHASIVDCNRNLLHGLQTNSLPETHGADNLKTVELVFAAYDSTKSGQSLRFQTP